MPAGYRTCKKCGGLTPCRGFKCKVCGADVPEARGIGVTKRKSYAIDSLGHGKRKGRKKKGEMEDFSKKDPRAFAREIDLQEVLRAMITERKGSSASFGSSYVKTIREFLSFLSDHGHVIVKVASERRLEKSLENASREWEELRVKYGLEEDGADEGLEAKRALYRRLRRAALAGT